VVYKVDRLSRSLLDFARLLSLFEKRGVSFVSVTQVIAPVELVSLADHPCSARLGAAGRGTVEIEK